MTTARRRINPFENCQLDDAVLDGASFVGSDVTSPQLVPAKSLRGAHLPEGILAVLKDRVNIPVDNAAPVPQPGEDTRHCGPARDAERDDLVAGQGDERAVESEIPIERGARGAVAHEPEPREHHGVELAEQARAGARHARRGESRQTRPPLAEGLAEVVQALARER